jgi:hypothetical protein
LTGPTDVSGLLPSSSQAVVGMVSTPPATVGASGPVVGVPPLRVWRSQYSSSALPSNSDDRG